MHDNELITPTREPSRRDFLKSSTATVVGTSLAATLGTARYAHAAGDEVIRIALVGCGGRGTGAAAQALQADPYVHLVAMADAFADQLEASHGNLMKTEVSERLRVDNDHKFVGLDAYEKAIASDVDIVLLATPPHFRPMHLKAAIDAGKHVFAEKPVAVDAPGIRSVLATTEEARKKNLSIVSGLCWRYETGMIETIKRIHDGQIGRIVALETMRLSQGVGKLAERQPGWTDMEYQLRNWYYYTWLSGDFNVEQFVHELDKMAWAMGDEYPVDCSCVGGRQTRIEPHFGHIYDHFSAVYNYADGQKLTAATRHQLGCSSLRGDITMGTKGTCDMMKYTITGENPWRRRERITVMHQLEHDAMYAALRRGEIINNGEYMAKSTMMAIIARMSAYTGKTLTWEQAMNSQEDLSPPSYDWNQPLPEPPVAMPGVTPFV